MTAGRIPSIEGGIQPTLVTTTGDIIYASSASNPARLGIGSSAQVLTVSGGIPVWSAPAGGGKVLQVVNATYATVAASATNTWVTTNLTASITPTLNTSKILVLVNQGGVSKAGSSSVESVGLRLKRGATVISTFAVDTSYTFTALKIIGWSTVLDYLDAPATTSATTYSTEFRSTNNVATVYVQDSATSSITLMEIGA